MTDEQKRSLNDDLHRLSEALVLRRSQYENDRIDARAELASLAEEALPHWVRRAESAESENGKLRADLVRVLTQVCHVECGCGDLVDGEELPACDHPCQTMRPTYDLLRSKEASPDGEHA